VNRKLLYTNEFSFFCLLNGNVKLLNTCIELDTVKIEELRPGMSDINIEFFVISKDRPSEITSRQSGETHSLAEAKVGDETGTVIIPLWGERINNVECGETYLLRKGFTDEYRGSLRLKIGKYSQLAKSNCEIEEINHGVNKSSSDPLLRYYRRIDTYFEDRLGYSGYNDFRGYWRVP
jgi:replication factor A1